VRARGLLAIAGAIDGISPIFRPAGRQALERAGARVGCC
jgi:hypothetical protein